MILCNLQEIPGWDNVSWNIYVALVICAVSHKEGSSRENRPISLEDVDLAVSGSVRRKVISRAAMYLQLKSVMWTREELVILILENIFFTLMEISLTLDFIFLEFLLQIKRKGKKKKKKKDFVGYYMFQEEFLFLI